MDTTIALKETLKTAEIAKITGVIQQIKHCLFRHIKTGLL